MNYRMIRSEDDFNKYFDRLSMSEVRSEFYELIKEFNALQENKINKIAVTPEQLEMFFAIKNPQESRGRKRTILTEEDKEQQRQRQLQYQRERYQAMKAKEEKE